MEDNEKEFITYFASGAGGQVITVIPELDIILVISSRNNLTKSKYYELNNIMSKFILPSIKF